MRRLLVAVMGMLLAAQPAIAAHRSLGPVASQDPVSPGGAPLDHPRFLINDGSFENGECDAGSSWTCVTDNPYCGSWIVDPLPVWGYPAYDGTLCGWLGGFCGTPNSNSFCQDVWLGSCGAGTFIQWAWMGYVENNDGNRMYVTVDGIEIFEKLMTTADHTYGNWGWLWTYAPISAPGTYTLCFGFEATTGASMLIDYVTSSYSPTAATPASLSAIKSLY